MKSILTAVFATIGAVAALATPTVDQNAVTMTQDSASRRVTIKYTLTEEPGIVTVDIQTNAGENAWVSIGEENIHHLTGDVNKRIDELGSERTIVWQPQKSWPNQKVAAGNIRAVVTAWATNAPPDYMVCDLTGTKSVFYYTSSNSVPDGVLDRKYKTDYLVLRKVPAAGVTFRMGSGTTELGHMDREILHHVSFTNDYYIGIYPITQRQWMLVRDAGSYRAYAGADRDVHPIDGVSYNNCRGHKTDDQANWPNDGHRVGQAKFMGRLRALVGNDGFDLPTEAQWEFACRAGCGSALYSGKELTGSGSTSTAPTTCANVNEIAWYAANSGGTTQEVGLKLPNAWGLYDMVGNVFEWCRDWYAADGTYSDGSDVTEPTGPASGSQRVRRGLSYKAGQTAERARSAYRNSQDPSAGNASDGYTEYGFRVVCELAW